jgi:hypothetical protein
MELRRRRQNGGADGGGSDDCCMCVFGICRLVSSRAASGPPARLPPRLHGRRRHAAAMGSRGELPRPAHGRTSRRARCDATTCTECSQRARQHRVGGEWGTVQTVRLEWHAGAENDRRQRSEASPSSWRAMPGHVQGGLYREHYVDYFQSTALLKLPVEPLIAVLQSSKHLFSSLTAPVRVCALIRSFLVSSSFPLECFLVSVPAPLRPSARSPCARSSVDHGTVSCSQWSEFDAQRFRWSQTSC